MFLGLCCQVPLKHEMIYHINIITGQGVYMFIKISIFQRGSHNIFPNNLNLITKKVMGMYIFKSWTEPIPLSNFWVISALKSKQNDRLSTLRQNGCHFADNSFKYVFFKGIIIVWNMIKISVKFVPKGPINIITALVQIMAWHLPGNKLLSEPMMVTLLMHIRLTLPQWVGYAHMTSWTEIRIHYT